MDQGFEGLLAVGLVVIVLLLTAAVDRLGAIRDELRKK